MGLLEKLFPRRPPGGTAPREYFKTLTAYQPVYTTYRGGLYEMELTRAAIAAFARHCSKLHLEVTGDARPDLRRVLGMQPNPFMDASKFLARLATIYLVQNNAFIVPMEDSAGRLIGYYPVLPQQSSVREYGGEPYLQYSFWGGQKAAIELNRAGILTQHQYEDDFFGSDNRPLMPTMQMAQTQAEGIINGIKNATTIRFLARLNGNLKEKDITAERERFARDNLAGNATGVAMFDSKYADVKQIESAAMVVSADGYDVYVRGNRGRCVHHRNGEPFAVCEQPDQAERRDAAVRPRLPDPQSGSGDLQHESGRGRRQALHPQGVHRGVQSGRRGRYVKGG